MTVFAKSLSCHNLKEDHWNVPNFGIRKFLNGVHVFTKFHENWQDQDFFDLAYMEWPVCDIIWSRFIVPGSLPHTIVFGNNKIAKNCVLNTLNMKFMYIHIIMWFSKMYSIAASVIKGTLVPLFHLCRVQWLSNNVMLLQKCKKLYIWVGIKLSYCTVVLYNFY